MTPRPPEGDAGREQRCGTCHAYYNKHSNDDLCCPAYTAEDGTVVFSETHHFAELHLT